MVKPNKRRQILKALGGLIPLSLLAAVQTEPTHADSATGGSLDESKIQDIIATIKPAVAMIEVETAYSPKWASGFFVSSDGLLITNAFTVKDAVKVTCLIGNKDRHTAKVLKIDRQYDMALLKVDLVKSVPTVLLGDSEALSEGQAIGVTGYPEPGVMVYMGMALDSSTSRGSLNGIRFGSGQNTFLGDRSLQIDAPVAPGNFGGPVFRLDTGEVIGVLNNSVGGDVTLAVPANQIKVMIAGGGLKLKPNVAKAGSPAAAMEPGDLRTLNSVGDNKEISTLFGQVMPFTKQFEETAVKAIEDWTATTGKRPNRVTRMVLDGDDIFFGGTDGRLRRWDTTNIYAKPLTMLAVPDDYILIDAPAVTSQIICATAGALDLSVEHIAGNEALASQTFGLLGKAHNKLTIDGRGSLFGINRRNGNIDWEYASNYMGTPILYNNRIYYGGMGVRGCLDALQGGEIWTVAKTPGNRADWFQVGYAGPLGVYGVVVPVEAKEKAEGIRLFGSGQARVEKYDPDSKAVVWKTPPQISDMKDNPQPLGTAIFVDEDKKIIYALAGQVVSAVNADTGALLWQYDHYKAMGIDKKDKKKSKLLFNFTSNMVIHDGIIYIGSEDRKLYALNGADGTILWKYPTRGVVGQPTYFEGQILVGSADGYLHVVDAHTGQLQWLVNTESAIRTCPLIKSGMVFAATDSGSIFTIRAPGT